MITFHGLHSAKALGKKEACFTKFPAGEMLAGF
jgi:hypothetical protein